MESFVKEQVEVVKNLDRQVLIQLEDRRLLWFLFCKRAIHHLSNNPILFVVPLAWYNARIYKVIIYYASFSSMDILLVFFFMMIFLLTLLDVRSLWWDESATTVWAKVCIKLHHCLSTNDTMNRFGEDERKDWQNIFSEKRTAWLPAKICYEAYASISCCIRFIISVNAATFFAATFLFVATFLFAVSFFHLSNFLICSNYF